MPLRFRLLPLLIAIALLGLPPLARSQAPERPRLLLSVQELEAIGVRPELARGATELLRTELATSSRLRLLEETGRLWRLQRESASLRDLFEEGSLRRLGQLLESRHVVTGSLARLDSVLVLSARLVDAETGEVLASESVRQAGPAAGLPAAARELARKLAGHFPLTGRVIAVRGDTLVADLGARDGLRTGEELTIAELLSEGPWRDPEPPRSVRCRVARLEESQALLLPLRQPGRWPMPAGSVVVAGSRAGELAAGLVAPDSASAAGRLEHNAGSLLVESEPEGALVYLAGLDVGRTPVRLGRIAAGWHPVLLALPGCEELEDSVLIRPGIGERYRFTLTPQRGRLTVVFPQPGITLRIDTLELELGERATVTLQDFPAGGHWLEARKAGYQTLRRQLQLEFPRDSTLTLTLEPYPGSLLVLSEPAGAELSLDGLFLGRRTPWRLTHLAPGPHQLRVSLPRTGAAESTIEVRPGEDRELRLTLDPQGFGLPPQGMSLVPGGPLRGPDDTAVEVDSFWIDTREVTNRAYALFVETSGHKPPSHWKKGAPPSGQEQYPVTQVSWNDAARFAAWCGKRLPTEAEWERATMGAQVRPFPWGDSYRPGLANTWSEGRGESAPAGSYPEDRSVFGLLDVVGNVAEWVDGWLDPARRERVFRGGSFYVNQLEPSLLSRDGHYPVSGGRYIGFRCARDLRAER